MIADDDVAIVEAMKMLLEMSGYEVLVADNQHILTAVTETAPDLILLDIWMGGTDGREVCKQMKATDLTKHIPVILISASNDFEKDSKNCGANDFIAKPFDLTELEEKIAKHLG